MSFQDFSSSRPRNASSSAASNNNSPSRPSSASSGFGSSINGSSGGGASGSNPLAQVSEALLQYQRNVGILENIVASMTTSSSNRSNGGELQAQYRAQVDVLDLLGRKVRSLLDNSLASATPAATATARTKLARDFDRVQAQAQNLQERASRFQKATAATSTSSSAGGSSSSYSQRNNNATSADDYYQQVQLQLHQDRLAEEIMREREEEIRNINRGMHQVNEIYKDLAHIVGSQQESIDAIETQMEESRANAESGLKQVEKANEKFGSSNCTIS